MCIRDRYRLAEEKHLFLMEAFWIWLLPLYDRLREKEVLFLCQTVQLLRLLRADGKGLFAQNVLALLQKMCIRDRF